MWCEHSYIPSFTGQSISQYLHCFSLSSFFSTRSKNILHCRDDSSILPIITYFLPVPWPCQIVILSWYSTWSLLPKLQRYLSAYPKIKSLHAVPASSLVLSFCSLFSTFSIQLTSFIFLFWHPVSHHHVQSGFCFALTALVKPLKKILSGSQIPWLPFTSLLWSGYSIWHCCFPLFMKNIMLATALGFSC